MLATRPCDSESSRWPFSKFDPSPRKHLGSRMSSAYDSSLSTHQDWQGQYSYLPPEESAVFGQSFDQHHDPTVSSRSPRTVEAVTASIDAALKRAPTSPVVDNKSRESKSTGEGKESTEEPAQALAEDSMYTLKRPDQAHDESATSADTPALSMTSTHLSSVSSTSQITESQPMQMVTNGKVEGIKEEEDEVADDDEMIDVDGDQPSRPMTAAERTAARRKMKRFRLTHQQTRFLMSEFAKQPHPDAAHRERLSKEIPGLSPRQVQVWFQNRRAKIKRLTADDRNQMIKMRAVPDDFDNVQALHSPYGAVHGLGAPMGPPVEFGNPSYSGDTMMRPLMVDVRRHENDEHLSPTGLTPGFGGIGIGHGNGMSSSELISPMTPTSGDRYQFGGQMAAPLSAGPRLSSPLAGRQTSIDGTLHMTRQNMRPLQPLHLRDPLTRSRSDTVHSPLRTSMSWKGDSMNYSTYPTPTSASDMAGRQHSGYDPSQMNPSSHSGPGTFDSTGAYTAQTAGYEHHGASGGLASTHSLGYPMPQQASATRLSRLRAASATLPLNLDIKEQHRSPDLIAQSASSGQRPRAPSTTTQLDNPSIYTTSYPPAPLTAPLEFSLSKSLATRNDAQHYSASQMSAPIHAPSDFSNAFQVGMSAATSRTPMRDSFGGGGPLSFGQSHDSSATFDSDGRGLDRKRSFTVSGNTGNALNTSESQP